MNFLILSTATGQGHNSAACAVEKSLESRGCRAKVLDVLKLKDEALSRHISHLYAGVTVHTPHLFHGLYRIGQHVSSPGGRSPIYRLNTLYAGRLLEEIWRFRTDVVICTHIFSAQAVTNLRECYGLDLPAIGIATDYTCIPFWEESSLDRYIIPSPALKGEFVARGVPADRIIPVGIPVLPEFLEQIPQNEARRALGLTAAHIFLVMGGSMGFGDIDRLASALTEAVPDSQVVLLCGSNKRLLHRITRTERIVPLGYTDRVPALMDAADVVLTKPGGLSSTEAIAKRRPLVLTQPIPGCEQKNAEFLSAAGAAAFSEGITDAVLAARRLALGGSAVRQMREAQMRLRPTDTDRRIADCLTELADRSCGSENG